MRQGTQQLDMHAQRGEGTARYVLRRPRASDEREREMGEIIKEEDGPMGEKRMGREGTSREGKGREVFSC